MAQLATTGHSAAESRTSGRRTHRQRQSHFVSIARVHAAPEVSRGSANTVCRATRRGTVAGLAACLHLAQQPARALPRGGVDARVANAFNTAFAAGGDFAAADRAWTDAINLDPTNSSAWSNRGTSRLQFGYWDDARAYLLKAYDLESANGKVSGVLLNQLGNADGAVGKWEVACQHYLQAAEYSPELESIANANLALAYCQLQKDQDAIRVARKILRKDPEFLDVRCALTAFLWAAGETAAAEGEWSTLQAAQGGLGAALYGKVNVMDRVKGRWPPRPAAALDAYLGVDRTGIAKGYDGRMEQYTF